MLAVQAMLVQEIDGTIQVLPAWPKEWNVEFKLHAPRNTIVEGDFRDGHWEHLEATPSPQDMKVNFSDAPLLNRT